MGKLQSIICCLTTATLLVAGCGDNCKPNDHTLCREGQTWWVDSCGEEGNLAETCACGCDADYTACEASCCQPDCAGRQCGDDGCGGECGPGCAQGQICDDAGQCGDDCSAACAEGALRCEADELQICAAPAAGCNEWQLSTDCAAEHRSCEAEPAPAVCGDCLAGYTERGGLCLSDVACEAATCSGHGSCDDAGGAPVCTCDPEYAGDWCGACAAGYVPWPADADTCVDDPCEPDPCTVAHAQPGSCVQTGATAIDCTCEAGTLWSGAECVPEAGCTDTDQDGCGVGADCACADCDDTDPAVYAQAAELCDGKDNDCDGLTDEDFTYQDWDGSLVEPGQACGTGACAAGVAVCTLQTDELTCSTLSEQADEACDDQDNDCDGETDEELGGDPCPIENEFGTCEGVLACQVPDGLVCVGQEPAQEACNGQDDDCDDLTDEDFTYLDWDGTAIGVGEACGTGQCAGGVAVCDQAGTALICSSQPDIEPEVCDDLDNDCDGSTDVSPLFAVHVHEPNESCATYTNLGSFEPNGAALWVPGDPTLYPGGDQDYYTVYAIEQTDSPLECLPLLCEERYQLVITLTRPPDAPGAQLCASSTSCSAQACTSGTSRTLAWNGACGGTDDTMIYFSVRSPDGSTYDCHAYDVRLDYSYWLVDGGAWPGCPDARR